MFVGGVLSAGSLDKGSSLTWDVLSLLVSDSFMLSFLSLREIARVRLTQKDGATRKRTHGVQQLRFHARMVIRGKDHAPGLG